MALPQLFVRIIKATGLDSMDFNGKSDPFCEIDLNGVKIETKVISKNLNPNWNESFVFHAKEKSFGALSLRIYDYDWGSSNDFMGQIIIPMTEFQDGEKHHKICSLSWDGKGDLSKNFLNENKKQKCVGKLEFEAQYSVTSEKKYAKSTVNKWKIVYARVEASLLKKNEELLHIYLNSLKTAESNVITSVIYLCNKNDIILNVLKKQCKIHIDKCQKSTLLFRGNSVITKMLAQYALLVGRPYLRDVLYSVIKIILIEPLMMEVDPSKFVGQDTKDENSHHVDRLSAVADQLIMTIFRSQDAIPLELRKITSFLYSYVNEKFSDESTSQNAVAGFFFLRFIVPAIVNPDGFGIIDSTPTPKARRGLILLSKVIQHMANGQKGFSESDTVMSLMNPFLEGKAGEIEKFLRFLGTKSPSTTVSPRKGQANPVKIHVINELKNGTFKKSFSSADLYDDLKVSKEENSTSDKTLTPHNKQRRRSSISNLLQKLPKRKGSLASSRSPSSSKISHHEPVEARVSHYNPSTDLKFSHQVEIHLSLLQILDTMKKETKIIENNRKPRKQKNSQQKSTGTGYTPLKKKVESIGDRLLKIESLLKESDPPAPDTKLEVRVNDRQISKLGVMKVVENEMFL